MKILKFENFINEKLGVSESSLIFVEYLAKRIKSRFLNFAKKSEKELEQTDNITFPFLKNHITDVNLWYKFPVVGFDIKYQFYQYDDFSFHKSFPNPKSPTAVGGGAVGFGNRNWTQYSRLTDPELGADEGIVLFLEIEIHVNGDVFDEDDEIHDDLLNEGIKATLYHELNHFYEMYCKVKNRKAGQMVRNVGSLNTTITHAGNRPVGISDEIVDYWFNNFINYTYFSEDFELRSNVQEIDFYFKEHPEQKIKDNRIFKEYDKMSKFDGDVFYQNLLKLIQLNKGDSYMIENLKNHWVSSYKKEVVSQKQTPIIPINKLEKMSAYEFIKWWEDILNKKGEYVKKKIYKLASSYDKKK